MRQLIPMPVISVVADVVASRETHATLDSLFMYAEAPGEPPDGSKPAKALDWLRRVNKDESVNPLIVLGRLIEKYMEADPDLHGNYYTREAIVTDKAKLEKVLSQCKLRYVTGGKVIGALGAPSQTLEKVLRDFDFVAIDAEFSRALEKVEAEPREAVSAASNILESFCKTYVADNGIDAPSKQDLKSVWGLVRKDLGFDPSVIEDRDLQTILTGLFATVEGIGSLRTHASSAHGAGKTPYKLEPRHARLAIHAAHTVTLFALETWEKRKKAQQIKQAIL